VLGKYLLATVICRSARLRHTYFQPQEQLLPFHKRRSAMAGEMRFPIPRGLRRVPKNGASRGKRGFPSATKGVTARSASIHGFAYFAWLPGLGRCRRLPAWRRHILSATHRAHAPSITVAPPPSLSSGSQAALYASSTRNSPVRSGCHRRLSPGSAAMSVASEESPNVSSLRQDSVGPQHHLLN